MKRSYYQKVAFLGILLLILLAFKEYTSTKKENFQDVKFVTEKVDPLLLVEFNPNDLDEQQWQNLGFTSKQVSTILNYKKIIGGIFTSKEQLKRCYAISNDKFLEIHPYILLPETSKEAKTHSSKDSDKKRVTVSRKFNPDYFSVKEWIEIGFSEKQAQAILKYKNYLGGSFVSKEKFKDCFIINDENYQLLAPYLILPEKTPQNYKSFTKNSEGLKLTIQLKPFDPNVLDIEGWQSLGFSQNQARTIVNYRDKNLKGHFKNQDEIKKCFVISPEKFEELKPYIKIHKPQIKEKKTEVIQQKTDFTTIDLNSITYKQLLEFGLDERSAGSIIGFRRKLGGFINKQQILDTYNIDRDIVQKLISTCKLDSSHIAKYTLTDAPEEWLKNHPYFKYSADKIILYRQSNSDDKKIWKLLKLKPEYETRMKLYLK
ncbi:helix-hairpin-helix domain-containing protein [Chryseobacterium paridis]|uniref:Helix-hairpin-helix domain-containing protein n=1 Tax=Chryseobacterium paridis TaxID=2800328 RepID=A0ABS1FTK0_9FLAO|nr:helix-hairpin-helix domain-containing protein [Chryseobacterium paridis]MBK1895752.1 helix-hairpin-helix domain-containing protein [Chryseobacterium paridis]